MNKYITHAIVNQVINYTIRYGTHQVQPPHHKTTRANKIFFFMIIYNHVSIKSRDHEKQIKKSRDHDKQIKKSHDKKYITNIKRNFNYFNTKCIQT